MRYHHSPIRTAQPDHWRCQMLAVMWTNQRLWGWQEGVGTVLSEAGFWSLQNECHVFLSYCPLVLTLRTWKLSPHRPCACALLASLFSCWNLEAKSAHGDDTLVYADSGIPFHTKNKGCGQIGKDSESILLHEGSCFNSLTWNRWKVSTIKKTKDWEWWGEGGEEAEFRAHQGCVCLFKSTEHTVPRLNPNLSVDLGHRFRCSKCVTL